MAAGMAVDSSRQPARRPIGRAWAIDREAESSCRSCDLERLLDDYIPASKKIAKNMTPFQSRADRASDEIRTKTFLFQTSFTDVISGDLHVKS